MQMRKLYMQTGTANGMNGGTLMAVGERFGELLNLLSGAAMFLYSRLPTRLLLLLLVCLLD